MVLHESGSAGSSGMARHELVEERLTHSMIAAFFEVYNTLGFGFLEHLYVSNTARVSPPSESDSSVQSHASG